MLDQGVDINAVMSGSLNDAAGTLAQADNELMARWGGEILEQTTTRPAPWTMTFDDYATELAAYESQIDTIRPLIEKVATGAASTEEAFVVSRWSELIPSGMDLADGASPSDIHDRIRRVADLAGLDGA